MVHWRRCRRRIAAPGEEIVATFRAEGAQIYECKPGNDGKLAWVFREPIATLLLDDKTVGRHYAGPTWEHRDGPGGDLSTFITSPTLNASQRNHSVFDVDQCADCDRLLGQCAAPQSG